MTNSRILAAIFAGTMAAAAVPGISGAQTPAAPAKEAPAKPAPAKESFRTWSWNKVSGNWKRMAGAVKQRWGKLTHNEIRESQGRRETLNGYIQSRYGIDRDAADKQIDEWLKTLK